MPKARNGTETGVAPRDSRTTHREGAQPMPRKARRGLAQGTPPARRGQDVRGKFAPGNQAASQGGDEGTAWRKTGGQFVKGHPVLPGAGRPRGSKDTRPRITSLKRVYVDLAETRDGHRKMLNAVDAGVQHKDARVALGYLELGAKVLDKTDEAAGQHVHFHLYTNVDFTKLDRAREAAGLPPLARRSENNGDDRMAR